MSIIIKTVRTAISVLSVVSPHTAVSLTFKLFCTPAGRATVRAREKAMVERADTSHIDFNGDKVCVYSWGDLKCPVLMVHGWESRGSRFAAIIEQLLQQGYSPVTFDMPGHGDSGGKMTTILECNEICNMLQQKYGVFEAVIAHSFGVPCIFYAIKDALRTKKIVTIGGLAEFSYLIEEFGRLLGLNQRIQDGLKRKVEGLFPSVTDIWDTFSVTYQPERVKLPMLIIHDTDDDVVQVTQAKKIVASYGDQAYYHETSGYGHKRILHQSEVVQRIAEFMG